jgi:hypothetical protein
VAAIVALAVAPVGALGAKPERFHEHVVDFFEGDNVCGMTVDVAVKGVFTDLAFFDKEGNFVRFKSTSSFRVTVTDADGDAVVVQNSGLVQEQEIVDEEAGTITFLSTFKGLPEKIQTAQGPLLLRDAGIVTFADTFDLVTRRAHLFRDHHRKRAASRTRQRLRVVLRNRDGGARLAHHIGRIRRRGVSLRLSGGRPEKLSDAGATIRSPCWKRRSSTSTSTPSTRSSTGPVASPN